MENEKNNQNQEQQEEEGGNVFFHTTFTGWQLGGILLTILLLVVMNRHMIYNDTFANNKFIDGDVSVSLAILLIVASFLHELGLLFGFMLYFVVQTNLRILKEEVDEIVAFYEKMYGAKSDFEFGHGYNDVNTFSHILFVYLLIWLVVRGYFFFKNGGFELLKEWYAKDQYKNNLKERRRLVSTIEEHEKELAKLRRVNGSKFSIGHVKNLLEYEEERLANLNQEIEKYESNMDKNK